MRLLNTETFELASSSLSVFKKEGYAALSHRWNGNEIDFEQLGRHVGALQRAGTEGLELPQLEKIRGACDIARAKGIKWMWIDSCCIDKSSAAELSEALNSMFQWYRDAKLCVTYLSDVIRQGGGPSKENFINEAGQPSVWFSRGWTLQELLAPRRLEFFDKNWDCIGDRADLAEKIENITRIQRRYLKGEAEDDFRSACIATKFSWLAGRRTDRDEDMAYSMLGLFGITMDPRYGEGWGAFTRLQKELLSSSTDESLFAWKMNLPDAGLKVLSEAHLPQQDDWKENEWGLLASRPEWFKDCGQMTIKCPAGARSHYIRRHDGGFFMRQQGLQISLLSGFAPHSELNVQHERFLSFLFPVSIIATLGLSVGLYVLWTKSKGWHEFQYTINCWDKGPTGEMARVRIWLRKAHSSSHTLPILKRVRCTGLIQDRDRTLLSRTARSGVVLQPSHL